MRQSFFKIALVLLGGLLMVPGFSMAQEDKDKVITEKEKKEKNKETEQIIIRRTGDSDEKMVIEIKGDKITVNGKSIDELKDGQVTVSRHKIKDPMAYRSQNFNGDFYQLFNAEANHAMLGVTTEKVDEGAKVNDVTPESAAQKIGLKEGDIITKINDTKIEDPDALSKAIRSHKPGDKVQITYLRDKKQQTVTAELTKWKGGAFKFDVGDMNLGMTVPKVRVTPGTPNPQAWGWSGGSPKLGLSVQDTDDGKGVKVIEVDAESNAAKAGVKENDLISEVDGKAVNSTDDMVKMIRESKEKKSIMLKLKRDGKTQNIEVLMPKRIKTADL